MLFPDIIWILLFMLSVDSFLWRAGDARLRKRRLSSLWRLLWGLFMGAQVLYVLIALILPWEIRSSRTHVPLAYHTQAYIWHLIVLPMVLVAVVGRWMIRRWRRQRAIFSAPVSNKSSSEAAPAGPSRRQMLATAAMALPPLASATLAARAVTQLREMRVRHFDLRLSALPRELDGMTITQVTDLHIGRFLHADRLPQIVEKVNSLESDFLVFTGDLIDLSMDDLPLGIDFLRKLKAPSGFAICEGNHDLVEDRGEFERAMKSADLPLLLSSTVSYAFRGRRVQFLGLPWNNFDEGQFEAMQFLRPQIDPQAFPIVLAHHPHGFDAAAQAGLPLTLSGHTHGGQLMLNEKLGAGAVRFRYISGLYQKAQSSLLVCNGIGNWFPLRANAPAELLHITLRSGGLT